MRRYKIDLKLDNINDIINNNRINKFLGAKRKKEEKEKIKEYLKDKTPIKKYPIKITFNWYIKNVNSDLDNKTPKSILDTLQEEKILINDNIKHITSITHNAIKSDKEYVELIIEEKSG